MKYENKEKSMHINEIPTYKYPFRIHDKNKIQNGWLSMNNKEKVTVIDKVVYIC